MGYKKHKFISRLMVAGIMLSIFIFWISLTDKDFKCKDCNVIMISLSNVSQERMSLYGYKRLTTPKLDQWAKGAIIFENAFTQTSWTLPVATSLFTSLYPYSHNVIDRFTGNVLDEDIQTLPEILKSEGYKTAAFTGGLDYDERFNHMRGFKDIEEAKSLREAVLFAGFKHTLNQASGWLDENFDDKFFLFLHGYDAHCPFDPPEQFRGTFSTTEGKTIAVNNKLCLRGYRNSDEYEAYYYRDGAQKVLLTQDDIEYLEDLYDEEILSVDSLVGNFLDNLDQAIQENTIIIIFSDHGEMFAKHGRFGRAGGTRGALYDDVVHIPLMIKVPKQRGGRIDSMVQIIDVMPTMLDILDLPQPEQTQGKNLVPLMTGEKENINDYVFAGSKFGRAGNPQWDLYPFESISESVRSKEWKLIHEITFNEGGEIEENTYELYNLKDDPDELRNVVFEQPATSEELKEVLRSWKDAALNYSAENASASQLLPPEIIEAAKERGYW